MTKRQPEIKLEPFMNDSFLLKPFMEGRHAEMDGKERNNPYDPIQNWSRWHWWNRGYDEDKSHLMR